MSGGHFDFPGERIETFADHLLADIPKGKFSHEVNEMLKVIVVHASAIARLAKAADYLFSGDMSEARFLGVAEEVANEVERGLE